MECSEEQKEINYDEAFESGQINSYINAKQNRLMHHYETALYYGEITQTKEDIHDIFGITMGQFKKCVSEFRGSPEYYIYRQFKYKVEKQKEIRELKIQLEAQKLISDEYREKYNELKMRYEE